MLDSVNIRKKINIAIRDIYKRYDSFVQRGSGWVLKKVSKFSVSIMKFKLFQGGCLSTLLPRELCKKCCCVSIKNIPKNKCSFYCVAAALCENMKNKYRKNKQHDKIIELLPFDNMEGPVSIQEIKYSEKNSCMSVNVCGYDKIPLGSPYYCFSNMNLGCCLLLLLVVIVVNWLHWECCLRYAETIQGLTFYCSNI